MNAEEKIKYNEYLEKQERLNEEAEKLRKILNQELKKLNSSSKELIAQFDNKISVLFMKRLEYSYRIYEQELMVLKLKKSIFRENLIRDELMLTNKDLMEI